VRPPARLPGAVLALLLATGLSGCGGGGRAPEVGTVERRSVAEVVQAPGAVVARASVALHAPAAATVDTLLVRSGDKVTAGDVLMTLKSPAAEDALARAESAAAQAEDAGNVSVPDGGNVSDSERSRAATAAFDNAQSAAEQLPAGPFRDAALAQVAGARASFQAAQAQAQQAIDSFSAGIGSLAKALGSLAGAQRVQAQAAVSAARRAVEALTVRAPVDGVVTLGPGTGGGGPDASALLGSLGDQASQAAALLGGAAGAATGGSPSGGSPLSIGSPVDSGGTLATVIDASELSLRADVDETDVLTVTEGTRAEVEFDALPGLTYSATVRSVDLTPTSSARGGVSYAVALSLGTGESKDGKVAPAPRPGMSAVISLQVADAKDAVSVPASALVRDGTKDTVWLVQNGRAARREVELGAEGDQFVEIRNGLSVGDRVVVRGADRVHAGDALK
jgi:HlyD family secretion protein